jgi:hypothetical protein
VVSQIKSRRRVQDHGEVFTNEHEVSAMLDMVKQETERTDSRFLEPACGDGNFLAEALRRKLAVVSSRYHSLSEWEKYAFVSVSSIYGVELLSDNTLACRDRLYGILENDYLRICRKNPTPGFLDAIRFVLERNILNGNALSLKAVDGHGCDIDEPIIFSEWSIVSGDKVKRRDFRLDEMLEGSAEQAQPPLFGASNTSTAEWEIDKKTGALIPEPIQEHALVRFYEVQNDG